jgi:hypothetical protein
MPLLTKNGIAERVYDKRDRGRFALPNRKYRHLDLSSSLDGFEGESEIGRANPKLGGRIQNREGESETGRANLLVSRIVIYAIIDQKRHRRACLR